MPALPPSLSAGSIRSSRTIIEREGWLHPRQVALAIGRKRDLQGLGPEVVKGIGQVTASTLLADMPELGGGLCTPCAASAPSFDPAARGTPGPPSDPIVTAEQQIDDVVAFVLSL